MVSILKFWCQSMRIYVKYIPAKFHQDPFWNDVALGFFVKWRHGCHLESMTSYPKLDSMYRWAFTCGTILPNFIPILFETMEPRLFIKRCPNNKNKTRSKRRSVPDLKIENSCKHTPCLALSSLYFAATSLNLSPAFSRSNASKLFDCFSHRMCLTCSITSQQRNQAQMRHYTQM